MQGVSSIEGALFNCAHCPAKKTGDKKMKKIVTAVIALVAAFSTFVALPACETMSVNDTQNGQQQDDNDETPDQGGEENPDNDDETQEDLKQVTQEQWEDALSEETFKNCHLNCCSMPSENYGSIFDFSLDTDNKLMNFKQTDITMNTWVELILRDEGNYYYVYLRSESAPEKWGRATVYDSENFDATIVAFSYYNMLMNILSNLKDYYSSFTYSDGEYVATNIYNNLVPGPGGAPQDINEKITVHAEFSEEKLVSLKFNFDENTGNQYPNITFNINISDYGTTKIILPTEFTEVGTF